MSKSAPSTGVRGERQCRHTKGNRFHNGLVSIVIDGCQLLDLLYRHVKFRAYMQNRLTNSQRYLLNAKPGTNHSTNPTNPNGNSKW